MTFLAQIRDTEVVINSDDQWNVKTGNAHDLELWKCTVCGLKSGFSKKKRFWYITIE